MSTPNYRTDRRGFLKDAAIASIAGIGCLTVGGVGEALARTNPMRRSIVPLSPGGPARPFHMVTLGDSIMWGQGLRDGDKFSTKVQRWLESQLGGRQIVPYNYSHSGAVIQLTAQDVPWSPAGGEVNVSAPSITAQLGKAVSDLQAASIPLEHIDLVLLDGGINDVGIQNILNPVQSVTTDWIRTLTKDRCVAPMRTLVSSVTASFPTAKVVVTDYFAIVGDSSNTLEMTAYLILLGLVGVGVLALPLVEAAKGKLVAQSKAFHEEVINGFRSIVADASLSTPGRVFFAESPIPDNNTYAAADTVGPIPISKSWLWRLQDTDPVAADRERQCQAAGLGSNEKCKHANTGHPNVIGANSYANKIIAQIYRFKEEWSAIRQMIVRVSPRPVQGQASTVTVFAEDRDTHAPVDGTVTVGAQTFATNKPFTFTPLCTKATTVRDVASGGRREPVRKPTREFVPGECTEIVVSARGYADAVVQ